MAKPTKFRDKWRVRWIDENGNRASKVFNSNKEASSHIKLVESNVESIRLGLQSPPPINRTFNELCDYWIDKILPQKRHREADLSIIRKHLRPEFGHLPIRSITREQIDNFQINRSNLDKKTISNHLTLIISLLNLAVELNWLLKAPKIKKPKNTTFSRDYRYLKNINEIETFLRSANSMSESVYMLYLTAIYTGMRAGELASLRREDVNLNDRIITVQRSFHGPTKSDEVRYIPILDALLPILSSWIQKLNGSLIFPNEAGNMHQESARIFQETLHSVLKNAGFTKIEIKGKSRHYIRFHDLRHTFASYFVMKGGSIFKLQTILGHKSIQMTQRYAHLAPDAFSAEYARFGEPIKI